MKQKAATKVKTLQSPNKPWEPLEPTEFFDENVRLGTVLSSYEDSISVEEFVKLLTELVGDRKDAFIERETDYGYYDEPDRQSIVVSVTERIKNHRYTSELKKYEKELAKYKTELKEYKRKLKLFEEQETEKELERIEKEIEKTKSGKTLKLLEKQLKEKQEQSKLNKSSGGESEL